MEEEGRRTKDQGGSIAAPFACLAGDLLQPQLFAILVPGPDSFSTLRFSRLYFFYGRTSKPSFRKTTPIAIAPRFDQLFAFALYIFHCFKIALMWLWLSHSTLVSIRPIQWANNELETVKTKVFCKLFNTYSKGKSLFIGLIK